MSSLFRLEELNRRLVGIRLLLLEGLNPRAKVENLAVQLPDDRNEFLL
jgi:hypothetical protein